MNSEACDKKDMPTKYWLNENGQVECRGDDCPADECDDSCPYCLVYDALELTDENKFGEAIELLKKATLIEPTYNKAWEYLGVIMGIEAHYNEAYNYLLKAYQLGSKNPKIIDLLITALVNDHRYSEALKWCDEYEKIKGENACCFYRHVAETGTSKKKNPDSRDFLEALFLLDEENGIINKITQEKLGWYVISKISDTQVITDILWDVIHKSKPGDFKTRAIGMAYAGIGAIYILNTNHERCDKNKLLRDELINNRGTKGLDEYVSDLVGWNYGSEESNKYLKYLNETYSEIKSYLIATGVTTNEEIEKGFIELCYAMFEYGIKIGYNIFVNTNASE